MKYIYIYITEVNGTVYNTLEHEHKHNGTVMVYNIIQIGKFPSNTCSSLHIVDWLHVSTLWDHH